MDKRFGVQALAALLHNPHLANFLSGRIYRGPTKVICTPGLNCYSCPGAAGACPIGSLQSFLSGVSPRFPAYVVGAILLMALTFGRFICGWLCPFGFMQELLYRLPGAKLGKSSLTKRLSQLKYVWSLLFVLILPLLFWGVTGIGIPAFCKFICPAGTLEGAVPLLLANETLRAAAGAITVWKFALLVVFLALMVVTYRPFCRWFCPLGTAYGCFNQKALFGIAVDPQLCIHCGRCAKVCGMDTAIAGDRECISCGDCLKYCPTKAIYFRQPFTKALSPKKCTETEKSEN